MGADPDERAANQDAAQKASAHATTPSVNHFDALGRTCLSVENNGLDNGFPQRFATRTALDTESKPLCIFDSTGRRVMESCLREPFAGGTGFRYVAGFDIAGNPLYRNGADDGERRTLHNIIASPLRTWDARGFVFRIRYDALHRPTHRFVSRVGFGETLTERFVYGEKHPDAARNLKGRVFRHYDGAGVVANERYDFKGNLLESRRQFARHEPATQGAHFYNTTPDWSAITNIADEPDLNLAALDAVTTPLMNASDHFISFGRFDAMNRVIQIVTPSQVGARPSVIQPTYNEANLLERLDVWVRQSSSPLALLDATDPATPPDLAAITNITYNPRGQREMVVLGNGVITTFSYDAETFRLKTLTTTRPPSITTDARMVQALAYQYDPIGNITRLRDAADMQNVVYFRNRRVEPSADYSYDPLYRLKSATGREHLGQTGNALRPSQQAINSDSFRAGQLAPGDGNAMGNYTERYEYDPVGNLTQMIHEVASGGWTRRYSYAEPSRITPAEVGNRLSATSLPGDSSLGPFSARYTYDEHGNSTRMPHLPAMTWDEVGHLQSTSRQRTNEVMPETTYYSYDAGGERLRKVTYGSALAGITPTIKSERLYFGAFEIYREYDGAGGLVKERETLHVIDNERRIVIVETRTVGQEPRPARLVRYQFSNHLGSSALELDSVAAVISYEEYFPFGSTSYQAVRSQTETPKHYRYTNKERDEESDLYHCGARYYVPWLGRWTSCDPVGTGDGPNLYVFVRNNPLKFSDPTGMLTWGQWAGIGAAIVVGAAVTVLTAGAAGPLVGAAAASVIGGIVGGAAGGAVGAAVESRIDHGRVDWSAVGRGAAVGAAVGGAIALATVGATAAVGAVAATAVGRAVVGRVAASAVGRAASALVARAGTTVAAAGRTTIGRGVAATGRFLGGIGRSLHNAGEGFGARVAGAVERRGLGGLLPQAAPGVPTARGPQIARSFEKNFGEPAEGVHVVGSRAEARATGAWPEGSSPTTSDVDLVIETARTDLTKHSGPGFDFFREINPGRVPSGVTGIGVKPGEALIGSSPGSIPKGGLIDPFFETAVRPPGDLRPFMPIWPTPVGSPHAGVLGAPVGSLRSDRPLGNQPSPSLPILTGSF